MHIFYTYIYLLASDSSLTYVILYALYLYIYMYNAYYVSFIKDGSIPRNGIIKIMLNIRAIETERGELARNFPSLQDLD